MRNKTDRTDDDRQPRAPAFDAAYALWLATATCALIATALLASAAGTYLLDVVLLFKGQAPLFTSDIYLRLLELAALFAAGAAAIHLYRLRLEAIRRAPILVPWPREIVVSPPGQGTYWRYECSCSVTLAFDDERPLTLLTEKARELQTCLENAFTLAVSDPVIRFSKVKMEQTLRVAARHVLGDGVSGVTMSEIRQRRVPIESQPTDAVADSPETKTAAG